MSEGVKIIAQNRKAFHDYFVEEKFEAGISLAGTEVKSVRMGNVNLKDAFACRRARRIQHHSALRLSETKPRKGRAWALPRQKALR